MSGSVKYRRMRAAARTRNGGREGKKEGVEKLATASSSFRPLRRLTTRIAYLRELERLLLLLVLVSAHDMLRVWLVVCLLRI